LPDKIINLEYEPFQGEFFNAMNRFPGFIAGWGSGKTMWALMKGILLSKRYDDNLGVIVRSKFTDLRDSTMKDFTRYTGIHVPQGTKEAKIVTPTKGISTIYFRHAKELSGLQNVNLGWFYIEQAEEFPTSTQFDLLRGRLRRVLTPKPEIQEQLTKIISEFTGRPALNKVVLDWQSLSKKVKDKNGNFFFNPILKDNPNIKEEDRYMKERDIAEFALVNQLGMSLRQGMVIANANGHNWCWKMFIKSPQKEYSCVQATGFDNACNLPADTLADWQTMEFNSPSRFKQYVMNNHDEVDLDACYWSPRLSEIRRDGHMGVVPYNPEVRVHLAADVGLDCTALWFFQLIGRKRLYIDYYENTGKFADHYARILDEKKKEFGYNYGRFVMPRDAKKRSAASKESFSKIFKDLHYDVFVLNTVQNLDVAINNANNHFTLCWFDENKCELGLEALLHYRRGYDEENKIYTEKPLHDWASHPASSMIYSDIGITKGVCGMHQTVSDEDIKRWQKRWSRAG